jgi:hypothetical protein
MDKIWHEPRLEELLSDPMVDILLLRDRISREDLPHDGGGASDAGAGASGMGRAVTPPRNLSCGKVLRSVGAIDVLQCSSDIFALHHASGRRIESCRRGARKP